MARSSSPNALIGINALAAVWLVGMAAATSDIGRGIRPFLVAVYSGAAILAAWVAVAIILRKRIRSPWAWVVAPLSLALGLLLSQVGYSSNPVFRLRFLASRGNLARVAEAVFVADPAMAPHRIGLFWVDRIEVAPGQARFLSPCGLLDTCGLVYSPVGRPQPLPGEVLRPLGGPWYHVLQRW
jgi:hypothetical protein